MMNAYNSSARDLPALRTKGAHNPAFLHPDELARLGLAPGDVVEIASEHAAILGVVEADPTLRPGLVSMSHAFGDAPDGGDATEVVRSVGSNTGALTSVERDYDRFSGLPRMSDIPVRVARV
jgi:anaerobic selenocysteine-containing dehydrogenase